MQIKHVTVGIKSLEEGLKDFAQVFKDAQKGLFPKKPIRGTHFVSLEAMLCVLTAKRLEHFKAHPEEAARITYVL